MSNVNFLKTWLAFQELSSEISQHEWQANLIIFLYKWDGS